jgi:hypothetical protein
MRAKPVAKTKGAVKKMTAPLKVPARGGIRSGCIPNAGQKRWFQNFFAESQNLLSGLVAA